MLGLAKPIKKFSHYSHLMFYQIGDIIFQKLYRSFDLLLKMHCRSVVHTTNCFTPKEVLYFYCCQLYHIHIEFGLSIGLFADLLKYTMNENEKFRSCTNAMPRNCLYIAPIIQNDIIQAAATALRKSIVEEINEADYLTILIDGTKNKHGVETLSVAFRFVNKNHDVDMYLLFVKAEKKISIKSHKKPYDLIV